MKIPIDRARNLAILDHGTASTCQKVEEAVRALHAHPEHVGGMLTVHDRRRVDFGVSRMWDRYAAAELPRERRVFRDLDEAVAWLREDAAPDGSLAAACA